MVAFLNWLYGVASRVREWFGDLWGYARAIVKNWYTQIYYLAVRWYDKIKRYANDYYNNLKRLADDLWSHVYLIVSTWYDKIKYIAYEKYTNTKKVINDWYSNIEFSSYTRWSNTKKVIDDYFPNTKKVVSDWWNKTPNIVDRWYNNAKFLQNDFFPNAVKVVKDWYSKETNTFDRWWSNHKYIVNDVWPQTKKVISDWYSKEQNTFDRWWNNHKYIVNDAFPKVKNVVDTWYDDIKNFVLTMYAALLWMISNTLDNLNKWASRYYPAATAIILDPVNFVLGVIEGVIWTWLEWLGAIMLGGVGIEDPERPNFGPGSPPGAAPPGPGPYAGELLFPLTSKRISGNRFNNPPGHMGTDYGLTMGQPVWSMKKGTVISTAYGETGYGHFVTIGHDGDWWALYAHLEKIYVAPGQRVGQGQTIATGDSTGHSTGPHLHLEIKKGGRYVDPESVFP
jgi:hypothetical protein